MKHELNVNNNNLIEDGVTDAEDVDYHRVLQQRQQVVGHPLPEVEQEVLDLRNTESLKLVCI